MRNRRLARTILLAAVLAMLGTTIGVKATPNPPPHGCDGNLHPSSGEPVGHGSYNQQGQLYITCHGKPGNEGDQQDCVITYQNSSGSGTSDFWVSCELIGSWAGPPKPICTAHGKCGGSAVTCGGTNNKAWAGDAPNGQAMIRCEAPGGAVQEHRCTP